MKNNDKLKRAVFYDLSRIVQVPVSDNPDDAKVIIRASTWAKLLAEGLYPVLSVDKDGYVIAWSPYHRYWKRLARLIANANSVQQVSLKDGNERNLLEENIILINPDPPKPITYDRTEFLTTELGTYHDVVDHVYKDLQPKL
jgi:hypothetical protein